MGRRDKYILNVLDRCCEASTFPMLDNGYVYLAATRLSLFRSTEHWALVVEVFGYSPRAGDPDLHVYTFSDQLRDRDTRDKYVSDEAYRHYLASNPYNESRFFYPVESGNWRDEESLDFVALGATTVTVRERSIKVPTAEEYDRCGIRLEDPGRPQTFEMCRYLATVEHDRVLAMAREQQISVPTDTPRILQLEEWQHPNVVDGEKPSQVESFQQLAYVLDSGDVGAYRPTKAPNTHWRNWPDGGRL